MAKRNPSDKNPDTNTGTNPQPVNSEPVGAIVPEATVQLTPVAEAAVQGDGLNDEPLLPGVITEKDLTDNPDLKAEGMKEADSVRISVSALPGEGTVIVQGGEQLSKDLPPVTTEAETEEELIAELMGPYMEHYPDEKMFYITSDLNVFLQANNGDALNHQRSIDKDSEPFEFLVK
jgi:hypothetical protein